MTYYLQLRTYYYSLFCVTFAINFIVPVFLGRIFRYKSIC